MLDVPVSTVRFWESRFDGLRPVKGAAGHRKYTVSDVERLKVIYHLVKEKGMTLEGARRRLKEDPGGVARDQEIVDRLLRVRATLMEIREELREVPEGEVYHAPEPVAEVAEPVAVEQEAAPKLTIMEQTLF